MPKGEPVLSEQDLHLIRSWIAAGAMDDSAAFAASAARRKKPPAPPPARPTPPANWPWTHLFSATTKTSNLPRGGLTGFRCFRRRPIPPTVYPGRFTMRSTASSPPNGKPRKLPEAKTPPPVCDDATFLRRVYLDLIGVIPSAESSRKFVADKAPGQTGQGRG